MNSHWRSRDLYKAWFMNAYALTDLQRIIAQRIAAEIGQPVKIGRYVDITDSLHIYGSYFRQAKTELAKLADGQWQSRSWPSDHPAFKSMTDQARNALTKDPDCYAKGNR